MNNQRDQQRSLCPSFPLRSHRDSPSHRYRHYSAPVFRFYVTPVQVILLFLNVLYHRRTKKANFGAYHLLTSLPAPLTSKQTTSLSPELFHHFVPPPFYRNTCRWRVSCHHRPRPTSFPRYILFWQILQR